MANPEVNGDPVALDFSSKGGSTGYSSTQYASNWEDIFGENAGGIVDDVPRGTPASTRVLQAEDAIIGSPTDGAKDGDQNEQ